MASDTAATSSTATTGQHVEDIPPPKEDAEIQRRQELSNLIADIQARVENTFRNQEEAAASAAALVDPQDIEGNVLKFETCVQAINVLRLQLDAVAVNIRSAIADLRQELTLKCDAISQDAGKASMATAVQLQESLAAEVRELLVVECSTCMERESKKLRSELQSDIRQELQSDIRQELSTALESERKRLEVQLMGELHNELSRERKGVPANLAEFIQQEVYASVAASSREQEKEVQAMYDHNANEWKRVKSCIETLQAKAADTPAVMAPDFTAELRGVVQQLEDKWQKDLLEEEEQRKVGDLRAEEGLRRLEEDFAQALRDEAEHRREADQEVIATLGALSFEKRLESAADRVIMKLSETSGLPSIEQNEDGLVTADVEDFALGNQQAVAGSQPAFRQAPRGASTTPSPPTAAGCPAAAATTTTAALANATSATQLEVQRLPPGVASSAAQVPTVAAAAAVGSERSTTVGTVVWAGHREPVVVPESSSSYQPQITATSSRPQEERRPAPTDGGSLSSMPAVLQAAGSVRSLPNKSAAVVASANNVGCRSSPMTVTVLQDGAERSRSLTPSRRACSSTLPVANSAQAAAAAAAATPLWTPAARAMPATGAGSSPRQSITPVPSHAPAPAPASAAAPAGVLGMLAPTAAVAGAAPMTVGSCCFQGMSHSSRTPSPGAQRSMSAQHPQTTQGSMTVPVWTATTTAPLPAATADSRGSPGSATIPRRPWSAGARRPGAVQVASVGGGQEIAALDHTA